jgi:hypothetical protein
MNSYELCVNAKAPGPGVRYATLEEAKAAGRVAISPTAEEEEAPGSFLDLDSFFAVDRIAPDTQDKAGVYDSRWPT